MLMAKTGRLLHEQSATEDRGSTNLAVADAEIAFLLQSNAVAKIHGFVQVRSLSSPIASHKTCRFLPLSPACRIGLWGYPSIPDIRRRGIESA
jgi:hypothetical protein